MRPTARARAAPRRRDRPAIAWLPPRLRRHVRGRFERLEIGHEFPDGIGRQQTAIRRHAVRLAVTNRLEDLRIGAAVAPAAVAQAGAHPTHRPAAVTAVAVHHAERPLAFRRRLPVSAERIPVRPRGARRRRDAAREDARVRSRRAGRSCGFTFTARRGNEKQGDYRAKIHTMPPWLVCRAMSDMKSAGGRTSAGSSDRTSPASRNQSPPIPAYTATYCLPSGPVYVIGAPTTPEPTLNFHSTLPLLASAALNQPSSVP